MKSAELRKSDGCKKVLLQHKLTGPSMAELLDNVRNSANYGKCWHLAGSVSAATWIRVILQMLKIWHQVGDFPGISTPPLTILILVTANLGPYQFKAVVYLHIRPLLSILCQITIT